ncbi:MAG: alanine racemase [Ignavibacteriae bacterium]|nr:alanine racemase [Ignavibacteriota bacterium]
MPQKQFYEKPTIIRHSVGLSNKFGRAPGTLPMTHIDGVAVKELVQKFGSPLYVVSESTLRKKYRDMQRAFSLRYPKVQISYSYKTNYLNAICATLHKEGAWAETVSGFEYEIARSLNIPGKQIILNGPYKTKKELEKAISEGALVNIDSYDEMYLLEDIAREQKKQIEIGVRVNMELNYPPWDRFGFNVESGQAFDAIKRMMSNDLLKVRGLHCHAGTYIDNVETYRLMAEKLVNFYHLINKELKIKLQYWDVGGGYAAPNTLHTAYLPGSQTCPTFDQYAEVIGPMLLRGPFTPNEAPLLFLEPGRSIVEEAMHMVSTVHAAKRLSTGAKSYVIDAGVNQLFSSFWYRYDVVPAQEGGVAMEDSSIYGPLCMQIDCVRSSISLPQLRSGDLVVVKNIGAYNFSQSMQFIQPRAAIVMISDGKPHLVRERETMEYIKQLDKVPNHLKA